MAQLWQQSFVPQIGADGRPIVGAQAFFFNEGTSTPQQVYTSAALDIAHDQPVLSNVLGRFPAVFLNTNPGTYRERVLDADDVEMWDVDEISVPQNADYVPPDAGETSETLLFRTGDIKKRYGTGTHPGFVRCNGRTIGSATSGANERANDDCEDLFLHLWSSDANLVVSGGRGGNAAGDWAANKTITLPDMRNRALIALGDMGNSDANLIPDDLVDGAGTNTTLGATAGSAEIVLTAGQMPEHDHAVSGSTGNDTPDHTHSTNLGAYRGLNGSANRGWSSGDTQDGSANLASGGASTRHTHPINLTSAAAGSDEAHPNLQPGMFVTFYIKL